MKLRHPRLPRCPGTVRDSTLLKTSHCLSLPGPPVRKGILLITQRSALGASRTHSLWHSVEHVPSWTTVDHDRRHQQRGAPSERSVEPDCSQTGNHQADWTLCILIAMYRGRSSASGTNRGTRVVPFTEASGNADSVSERMNPPQNKD